MVASSPWSNASAENHDNSSDVLSRNWPIQWRWLYILPCSMLILSSLIIIMIIIVDIIISLFICATRWCATGETDLARTVAAWVNPVTVLRSLLRQRRFLCTKKVSSLISFLKWNVCSFRLYENSFNGLSHDKSATAMASYIL